VAFDSKNFLYYSESPRIGVLLAVAPSSRAPDADTTPRRRHPSHGWNDRYFPELASVASTTRASGTRPPLTRDQMPRAGKLEGLFYAGGYAGHGIAMATYLGEQIGRRIAGEPIDNPFFDDRFPAIPLYSGNPWFLPLVGAYYQVQDWVQ
jgi:glycine/D-amino acid oxidase-like deaminating enzyme